MTYTSGKLAFEVEVSHGKMAFEVVAAIAELFEEPCCGCCQSVNIRPQVRDIEAGKYFEWICLDCRAQLSIGQKKDNKTLFVKRWDKDRKQPMPNRGWYHYGRNEAAQDTPQEAPRGGDPDPNDCPF